MDYFGDQLRPFLLIGRSKLTSIVKGNELRKGDFKLNYH
jgi:hypothetical protein